MDGTVIIIVGRDPMLLDGGSESYTRALGRAAIQAGYEPHIFCVGTASRTESTPFGVVHCSKSPFRPLRGLMVVVHAPYLLRAVDRFVASRGIGPEARCLVHTLGNWSGVGAAAARRLAARGIACTIVSSVYTSYNHETRGKLRGVSGAHGTWAKLVLRWEMLWTVLTVDPSERRGLRRSDLVLVNYESVSRIVTAEFGSAIRLRRITYAPETAFLRSPTERPPLPDALARLEPKDAPLVLAVARHDARKGLDVLLRALAILRAEGVPFRACLAGGGGLLDRHRALAAELGLLSCTALPGRVPDALAYLKHADIFALPSIEEGSGSVALLEALQAGVAPVVSRADGLPEDVTEGESALLVAPGDAGDLAQALRRLLGDAALRARLARGASATFHARFSAEAFAADLSRIYVSLGFAPATQPRKRPDRAAR
jgi:glycosyltransferase involved in cell wall biosynthesis